MDRIWLDVPYVEKDLANAGGVKWYPSVKRWYAPRVEMAGLSRWGALPDIPVVLPGEDRSLGHGLFVDLVPDTCWFTNVRVLHRTEGLGKTAPYGHAGAGMQCEICGFMEDRASQRWLEVHERWQYDWPINVQC